MKDRGSGPARLRIPGYGTSGPPVVVLHGGPGAPGYVAPVALALAEAFRVLEPFQRQSATEPLTVARHVADLHEVVSRCGSERPALVGHSWGAMLALAYPAAHPGRAAAIALVDCGTFDTAARHRLRTTLAERMGEGFRQRLAGLTEEFPDPDERLAASANLTLPLYSFEPIATDLELEACDARAHEETWADMVRLQEEGVYPAAFDRIDAPALMLQGAGDPHPGRRIRASLDRHIPEFECHEGERCGHYPWLERFARDGFFEFLRKWLERHVEYGNIARRKIRK